MPQKSSVKRAARIAKRQGKGRSTSASSAAVGWREIALVLVCVELAIFILVFDPSLRNVFDLPKAAFTHALAWLLLGVLIVVALVDGVRVPASPLFIAFYALVAVEILTTLTATNGYVALYGEIGRYLGLTTHLVLALIAVAIAVASDYPRRVSWLGWTLAAATVAAGTYAIMQASGADPIRWVDLDSKERPFATFGNPDFYGQFLSAAAVAATAVALLGSSRPRLVRWGAAGLGALGAVLLVVVATRGAVIGVVAGLLLLGLFWLRRATSTRQALVRAAVGGVAIVGAFGLVVFTTPLGDRLLALTNVASLRDRVLIYEAATAMFLDHPLLGVGFENFAVAYPQYQQAESRTTSGQNTTNTSAHNWLLHLAATTGLAGLATTAALLAAFAAHVWRRARDPDATPLLATAVALCAYYGSGLVLPGAQSIHWIPWACLGVVLASDLRTAPTVVRLPRVKVAALGQLAIVLALSAMAFLQLANLSANRLAKIAETSLRAETAQRSVDAAREATVVDPGRAVYWNDLGRALELVDDQDGARRAYVEAATRSPYTPAFWWNLGRMQLYFALRGEETAKAACYDAFRRAVAASPQNPDTHDMFARTQLALGDLSGALASAERAIALYPPEPKFYTLAADIARRLSDESRRLDLLRQGVAATDSDGLRTTLARSLIDAGRRSEAADLVRAVLTRDPTNGAALALQKELAGP